MGKEAIKKTESDILEERFKSAKTIKGTRSYHSFQTIPENETELHVKKFSFSTDFKLVSVSSCSGRGTNRGRGRGLRGVRGRGRGVLPLIDMSDEGAEDLHDARGRGRPRRRGAV